jgi:hypothetical protein
MRYLKHRRGVLCVSASTFLCLLLSLPLLAGAEIYKYVDNEGGIHFTNVPTQTSAKEISLRGLDIFSPPSKGKQHRYGASSTPLPLCRVDDGIVSDPQIKAICQRHGLQDYNLVKAVIRAESAFDSSAVSPKGAAGLMQLMPGTARDMGVLDRFDPIQNLDGGVRYLKLMLDRFDNDYELAVAAYNAGPEAVSKYGGVPPYLETRDYVQRVRDYYFRYGR